MTCFLEEAVIVHDLVHLRGPEGWTLRKSCYRKLRLGDGEVAAMLREASFAIEHESTEKGLVTIKAVMR